MTQLNQKANYARYKLLHDYGGIWLDSDIVVFKTLLPLMNEVLDSNKQFDFIATASPEYKAGEPENGFLVSKAGSHVAKETLRIADERMEKSTSKKFDWGYLGVRALREAVKFFPYKHLPSKQIMPISWQQPWRFMSTESIKSLCDENTYTFMLFNEMFRRRKSKILQMSRKDLLATPKLIGQIFRKAMS
jgi:hypothetical protein